MKKSAENKKFIVYIHKNKTNNKVYIGITSNSPIKRWGTNGCQYKSNRHFWNAIQKYGWDNFEHSILFSDLTAQEASDKEVELIAEYKSNDTRFGYNQTSGGEYGTEISEETQMKMRESAVGKIITDEWRKHLSESHKGQAAWNKGLKTSDATKEKLRMSLMGNHRMQKFLEEHPDYIHPSSKAVEIDGIKFDSIKELRLYLGMNTRKIESWLSGENSMPEEYMKRGLSYYRISHEYIADSSNVNDKCVECDGMIFESMSACDRYYGLKRCTISSYLNGGRKMPKKFVDLGLKYSNKKRYWYKVLGDSI